MTEAKALILWQMLSDKYIFYELEDNAREVLQIRRRRMAPAAVDAHQKTQEEAGK
jgi:hypothetical protein